jgi:predicted transcriptional regulator
MPANPDQVSVPLPPELRAFVERKAAEQDRSLAYIVRQAVAEAARREAAKGKAA